MTITDQLEGLIPADGPMTKNDRIIAEAVAELRNGADHYRKLWIGARQGTAIWATLAFLAGVAVTLLLVG